MISAFSSRGGGMVIAAIPKAGYMHAQTRNGQHSFHQDFLAWRRDPSHAGIDRCAVGAGWRDVQLAGGRTVCSTGAATSSRHRSYPGRMAALEKVGFDAGHYG